MDFLKEYSATAWVVFFVVIYQMNAFAGLVAPLVILAFGICFVLYYRELHHFITKNSIVTAFLLVVLLSAAWSSVPNLSLWYGIQLCLTVATGIIIGVAATPRKIVRGIFIGMAIIIVLSVISGRKGASAAGPVLVGVTGGKTVLGMAAATLAAAGLAVLFDRQQNWLLRLSSLALIPVGTYYATHVQAATAKVAILTTPVAFLGFVVMRYLSPRHRWVMVLLATAVVVPLTIFVASSDLTRNIDQKVLGALHKDSTLTGRTVMWAKADQWISQAPILGHGYRAFWSSGSSDSVGILHFFRVADFRAFQLHNTIKEIRVDTGWVGLIAFLGVTLFFLYKVMAYVFLYPSAASAYLATGFLLTLATGAFTTIVGVFTTSTLFFYAYGCAAVVFFMNLSVEMETTQPNPPKSLLSAESPEIS